jgi:hypothetical protein
MQKTRSNEKLTKKNMKNKKNKFFSKLQNVFFSFLWTPPTFKPHNFLIFYSF